MADSAYVVHRLRGRLRLRLPQRKGEADYFATLRERLLALPGVVEIRANPLSGSVLCHYEGGDEAALMTQLEQALELRLEEGEPPRSPALQPLESGMQHLEQLLQQQSGGGTDLRALLFLTLAGLALRQILRGEIMTPAVPLIWYALQTLRETPPRP